jgi:uncharacterized protein (DUF433 family)
MTLRLPADVARGVQRLAGRFGHKPAQVGVRLVEEGLRRRNFPQIDLRETASGRVAYLAGTRFAVYWVTEAITSGISVERFASDYQIPIERIRMALAYAARYPDEILADADQANANREWLERQESSYRAHSAPRTVSRRTGKARR